MKRKLRINKEKNTSSNGLFSLPIKILTAFLLLVVAGILLFSYNSITQQFCAERLSTLDVISSKLTQNTFARFQTQWDIATVCKNRIFYASKKEDKKLAELLDDTANMVSYPDGRLFLFDDLGTYYSEHGATGRWDDQQSLQKEKSSFVTVNSLASETRTDSYMTFYLPFDKPLDIDGHRITHIALARKISAFDRDLSIGNYGKVGSAFVIHANGVRIYHQSTNDIFAKVYNILYAMRDTEMKHGVTLEQIRKDMLAGRSGTAHFVYQGVDYAMAYQYMDMHDWYSVYLIPMDSMGRTTKSFILRTVISIGSAAFALLVIFLAIILLTNKKWRSIQEETNQKLRAAVADALRSKEEANRANRAKSDFLSRMSHDIRTPLNGIIGMTSIAKASLQNPDRVTNCLDKITSSSDHLMSLVNDVLDMSQIENGKTEIHMEPFNLKKTLMECVHVTESRLMERPVSFVYEFNDLQHTEAVGDDMHLKQILLNILGNAVKFTPDGGNIRFLISEEDIQPESSLFRFEIQDTGKGMSEEFLHHLFEPFVQEGSSARSEYKGTGLGLTIVKELVDLMGGDIHVESRLHQGTQFTVTLRMRTDVPASEKTLPDQEISTQFHGQTIMIVEDNELNTEILMYMLEEADLKILTAENGREAVDTFRQSPPNTIGAILMDVMMPVMDGLEATRQIRHMDREDAAAVPIIAMTANAYTDDIEKTIQAGMSIHLAKPLNKDKLLQTLSKILN